MLFFLLISFQFFLVINFNFYFIFINFQYFPFCSQFFHSVFIPFYCIILFFHAFLCLPFIHFHCLLFIFLCSCVLFSFIHLFFFLVVFIFSPIHSILRFPLICVFSFYSCIISFISFLPFCSRRNHSSVILPFIQVTSSVHLLFQFKCLLFFYLLVCCLSVLLSFQFCSSGSPFLFNCLVFFRHSALARILFYSSGVTSTVCYVLTRAFCYFLFCSASARVLSFLRRVIRLSSCFRIVIFTVFFGLDFCFIPTGTRLSFSALTRVFLYACGVTVACCFNLISFLSQHTLLRFDERIILVRMRHTLVFISHVALYAPNEAYEYKAAKKNRLCDKLNSLFNQCPTPHLSQDTLIVLGDLMPLLTLTELAASCVLVPTPLVPGAAPLLSWVF